VQGNRLFTAVPGGGVRVLDVSNPRQPDAVAELETPGEAWHLALAHDLVYVAAGSAGLVILDPSH